MPESTDDSDDGVLDAHLVIGADGEEVYEVYQRVEAG